MKVEIELPEPPEGYIYTGQYKIPNYNAEWGDSELFLHSSLGTVENSYTCCCHEARHIVKKIDDQHLYEMLKGIIEVCDFSEDYLWGDYWEEYWKTTQKLEIRISWCDPDCDYEDDMRAHFRALKDSLEERELIKCTQ